MAVSVVVVCAVLFLVSTFCSSCLVNRFAFFPHGADEEDLNHIGAQVEHLFITTSDGERISAFYLPQSGTTETIVFFHGNAGNAFHRLEDAKALRSFGRNVLLIDYRGFGLSDGRPSEKGVYLDGAAAVEYLKNKKGVMPNQIVLYGRSLGAAIAVKLAAEHHFRAVVLVSPFTSGREMAPLILRPFAGHPFDSMARIAQVRAPILIMHGDRDDLIPVEMGRRLFVKATSKKRFILLKGAAHNDIVYMMGDRFFGDIDRFLDSL